MLIVLSLLFLKSTTAIDMIEQEVSKTLSLISLLEQKIESLKGLKSDLLASQTQIPENNTWLSWLEDSSSLPNRLKLHSVKSYSKFVSDSDFLPYKHFSIPGFISCLNDGSISVYNDKSVLIKEFSAEFELQYCSSSQSTDEIFIGSVDKSSLKVHHIAANETSNFPVSLVFDLKLFNDPLAEITAFTQYTRVGKKFWVIGDNFGNITVITSDGEEHGRTYGKVGQIEQIEKIGQQLVYSGKRKIAIINIGTMEVTSLCGDTIADIFKFSLDQSSAIIHVSLVNGEVLTFDSRFSVGNGPAYCKIINKNFARFSGNLASIKGGLLLWAGSSVVFFNTSFLEIDSVTKPEYYTLPVRYSRSLKSWQTANGNLLLFSGIDQIRAYVISPPQFVPVPQSGSGMDFGYFRIIAIAVIVIFFILWKTKNRKSKKDLEVEKLEKSLEELQRSMESTTRMSEELTSRFRNVEESTKHLSGLKKQLDPDSD